jgi:hypothetical protein
MNPTTEGEPIMTTFSFDDALAAIADYALALRSDSTASDSTLDDLQFALDCMLSHDDLAYDPDYADDLRDPDFDTFPSAAYRSLNPALADRANDDAMTDLRAISSSLFNLRP